MMDDQISQKSTEKPVPEQVLMEMLAGSIVTKLINVAAKLGIADELKDGAKSSDEVAAIIDAHPLSLYRFMRTQYIPIHK